MTVEEANYLSTGDRLRVTHEGLSRHDLQSRSDEGTYVSQFESPNQGRLVVVRLTNGNAYGFRLDELDTLRHRVPGEPPSTSRQDQQ